MDNTKNKTKFNLTSGDSSSNVFYAVPEKKPVNPKVEEPVPEVVEQAPVAVEEVKEEAYVPVKRKKRFKLSLKNKKALSGWMFCLPFVLGIIGIYIPIIYESIKVSFYGSAGKVEVFNFSAYVAVFTDPEGDTLTITHAIRDLIIQIPAIVIFALFMAIILNQKMTGRTFFRAIFFLPVILSTGVIDAIDADASMADAVENAGGGVDTGSGESAGLVSALDMQALLSTVNLRLTLGNKTFDLVEIVTLLINNIFNIVSRSGVQMLIFLSGLQSISPSIYESCQMEGATAWETFWKITLPMISPMILVNSIYTVVDLFTAADNRVMQALKGYGGMFNALNPGNHSAGIWVYLLLVLVVIVAIVLVLRTVTFYQKRD